MAAALAALRAELDLRRRLSAADADDAGQREQVVRAGARVAEVQVLKSTIATLQGGGASWTLSSVAGALQSQGDLAGALALHREGLAIRRRLAAQDPDNPKIGVRCSDVCHTP